MGRTNNRPYAMERGAPPTNTRLRGKKKLYSPRRILKMKTARIMTSVRAQSSQRRKLRFDGHHRRQDQADASKEFADTDEDEHLACGTAENQGTRGSICIHTA